MLEKLEFRSITSQFFTHFEFLQFYCNAAHMIVSFSSILAKMPRNLKYLQNMTAAHAFFFCKMLKE